MRPLLVLIPIFAVLAVFGRRHASRALPAATDEGFSHGQRGLSSRTWTEEEMLASVGLHR